MKWYMKSHNRHYYCDDNGKILGSISDDGYGNYRALYEHILLGIYIELNFAKLAVENKHRII